MFLTLLQMKLSDGSKKTRGKAKYPLEEGQPMRWVGFGVKFIGILGIFTYAGYWADRTLQTSPWLMITGMSIAFVGMIYLLFKKVAHWRK